ncbi:MAG: hypothetical protein RSE41_08905 [Clostridia bacterium]
MNNVCYTIVIKQETCQNGISKVINNTYTNVVVNTEILLNFGYNLKCINNTSTQCIVQILNDIYIPSLTFSIYNESYKIFDLPCECGSYRVYIGVTLGSCADSCCVS